MSIANTRILHLGDIHFRGMSRHQEYRESFTRFFEQAQELSPDLIYIGGDIVHSKTQGITPEVIDILTWWFTELAKIAPTHIILGNHDGLVLNKDRQDAITPIINAIDDSNLYLYKKSGTYSTGIPGINWCVFSCFDEEGWDDVKPTAGDINIALFHGGVLGSKTDSDWDIEGEVTTDFFHGYDFTLLADIHTCQFLDDEKRIGYCGSAIQQNYGEDPGKGFLCWDIHSRDDFDVKFHPIYHANPFVTIEWKDNVKETLQDLDKSLSGARFRIRSNDAIAQSDIIHLHSELKHEFSASEVVFKIDEVYDTSSIKIGEGTVFKDDLRDLSTHVKLMRDYYKNADLSDDEWTNLEDLIRLYLSQAIKSDEATRNIKWSIRRMTFDNIFSYGKGNVIDFSSLGGITGIFGRNRSGKSSIVGTLVYGLFNTTDRGPIKNVHIINSRKGHCKVALDININGKNYRVERQSVKHENRKGQVNATTHLNFFQIDANGEPLRDLTEEQRRETEKVVRKKIGTADDFLMTSLASQGEMNNFIKERATARKLILTKFLDLNIFESMMQLSRDESSAIRAQMKNVPDRDWDVVIFDFKKKKDKKFGLIKSLESEINAKRLKLQNLQLELSAFEDCDIITPHDITRQESLISQINIEIFEVKENINVIDEEISQTNLKLSKVHLFKDQFSIESLREQVSAQRELEKTLIHLKGSHEKELTLLKNQKRSIKKLEDVPCGDEFPMCKFIRDSHKNKNRIEEQHSKVKNVIDSISVAQRALDRLKQEKLEEKVSRYDDILKKEADHRIAISEKKLDLNNLNTEFSSLLSKVESATTDLQEMKSRVVNEESDSGINLLKLKAHDLNNVINGLDAQRISLAQSLGKIESELNSVKEEKKKCTDLKTQWKVHNLFTQSVSKKGIPLQIIMSQLPIINAEITKILQNAVGFTVELEADINSNAMDIYINYGDSRRVIELASGMEKMISSLAIRVALINISSLPKTDILIIDEGFGSLDEMNIEACNRLLKSLKRWFKNILIISHVDAVKDVVDNVIDITRKGKDSFVSVQ